MSWGTLCCVVCPAAGRQRVHQQFCCSTLTHQRPARVGCKRGRLGWRAHSSRGLQLGIVRLSRRTRPRRQCGKEVACPYRAVLPIAQLKLMVSRWRRAGGWGTDLYACCALHRCADGYQHSVPLLHPVHLSLYHSLLLTPPLSDWDALLKALQKDMVPSIYFSEVIHVNVPNDNYGEDGGKFCVCLCLRMITWHRVSLASRVMSGREKRLVTHDCYVTCEKPWHAHIHVLTRRGCLYRPYRIRENDACQTYEPVMLHMIRSHTTHRNDTRQRHG